jgi:hypothetical protein
MNTTRNTLLAIIGGVAFTLPVGGQTPRSSPSPQTPPAAQRQPGLIVRLYEIDESVQQIPDLAPGETPSVAVVLPTLDIAEGKFPGGLTDQFLTEVEGFVTVRQPGEYTFRLTSDDGSRLWVDDRLVIDHDGLHGADPKDGVVTLMPGEHALRVRHFESAGGEALTLQWRPGGADAGGMFTTIPADLLAHDTSASLAASPGEKKIIPALRRGRPGDGTPVTDPHPGFEVVGGEMNPDRQLVMWLLDGRLRTLNMKGGEKARPAVAWMPPDEVGSSGIQKFDRGAYRDQMTAQSRGGEAKRIFLDGGREASQGCVFRLGPAGGTLQPTQRAAFEMLAVRALSNGFEIEFTKPLDQRCGWEADSYYVEQWPFDAAKGAPPTRDGVVYPVKSASVSTDRRKVFLEIDNLKPSHVVYLRLLPPCLSEDSELPWSTEAWYTLNAIPKDRAGTVLPRPPGQPQNFLTDAEKAAGWKLLFDGKSTAGWRGFRQEEMPVGKDGKPGWAAVDGCLVRVGPGGDIITDEEFDDFELSIEWRICPAGNSGIFFRVSEDEDWVWRTGPEFQVLDNAEHVDGRNALTSAASCYALIAPPRDATVPIGLFNKARIIARGPHAEYWLNGEKTAEFNIDSADFRKLIAESKFKDMPRFAQVRKGHIALQDHGDKVWYRNIRIRLLGER